VIGPGCIDKCVEVAKRGGGVRRSAIRIDTTVVETNAALPTDQHTVRDGVRVLTRNNERASTAVGEPAAASAMAAECDPERADHWIRARSPPNRDAMVRVIADDGHHGPCCVTPPHGRRLRPSSLRPGRRSRPILTARPGPTPPGGLRRMRPMVQRCRRHQTRARS